MHILVLCPHFAPDSAPTGVVMTAIVDGLAERGHRLHVVTALPRYEHHAVDAQWRGRLARHERTEWGRISRVHPFPTDKRNVRARALGFAGFTGLAGIQALLTRPRPDVVLAMSPPLPIGLAGLAVARARRAPFVFNIQDIFPDVAIELGLLTDRRVIKVASWAERFSYAHSDAVTVLSDDLRDNVEAKLAQRRRRSPTRVEVIPNFVDTKRITPTTHANAYRRAHGLQGKLVVMYAGNVGLSQSLELLIEDESLRADLGGPYGGDIPAWPGPDNTDVDVMRHGMHLFRFRIPTSPACARSGRTRVFPAPTRSCSPRSRTFARPPRRAFSRPPARPPGIPGASPPR